MKKTKQNAIFLTLIAISFFTSFIIPGLETLINNLVQRLIITGAVIGFGLGNIIALIITNKWNN